MKDLELDKAFEKVKSDDVFAMFLCYALAASGIRFMYRLLEACAEASEGGEDHAK